MNIHPTKYIGDLAVSKVIEKLVEKRWFVLLPGIHEHCKFDIVAYKQKDDKFKFIRIQVKAGKICRERSIFKNRTKLVKNNYTENDFDFYALYDYKDSKEVCFYH